MIISDLIKIGSETLKKREISYELFHSKKSIKLNKIGSVFINLKRKQTQNRILKNFKILISVHCHTIIPEIIIDKILCINFHPGYNPYNRGMFPQIFFHILMKKAYHR